MNTANTRKTKGFFYQILVEFRILFSSKFTIIIAALILLGSIAVPVLDKIQSGKEDTIYYGMDVEDLNVDGQIISVNNPQYWEIRNYLDEIQNSFL